MIFSRIDTIDVTGGDAEFPAGAVIVSRSAGNCQWEPLKSADAAKPQITSAVVAAGTAIKLGGELIAVGKILTASTAKTYYALY